MNISLVVKVISSQQLKEKHPIRALNIIFVAFIRIGQTVKVQSMKMLATLI